MSYEQAYAADRKYPINLGYWFPRIKDCGIKVPDTMIFTVPLEAYTALTDIEEGGDLSCVQSFISNDVIPHMNAGPYFMKNGCFSNKFDFRHCITTRDTLYADFVNICYESTCSGMFGAGGLTELVLRSVIPHDPRRVPAIYSGMPLRTEIRVFYDFDAKAVLYSANYWDYDTVRPNLRNRTDRIVFDYMHNEIKAGFDQHVNPVEEMVSRCLASADMTGKWSVDILVDGKDQYWLIDMATAERSAYWIYDSKGNPKPPVPPFDPAEEMRKEKELYAAYS